MSCAVLVLATRNAHKTRELRQLLGASFLCLTLEDFPGAPAVVEDGATFAANAAKKAAALAAWLSECSQKLLSIIPSPETPLCALADDSGLEVDALNGAPGVHSARFAALDTGHDGNSSDAANNAKLLRLLERAQPAKGLVNCAHEHDAPCVSSPLSPPSGERDRERGAFVRGFMGRVPHEQRTARFRCVLALSPLTWSAEAGKFTASSAAQALLFDGACEGRIGVRESGGGGFGYDPLFIPVGHDRTFAELGDDVKNTLSHRAIALGKLRDYLAKQSGRPGA